MTKLLILLAFVPFLIQKGEGGMPVVTPTKLKYFWTKDLTLKTRKFKSDTYNDTITDGYYSKREIVTYFKQKTMDVSYFDGKEFIPLTTLKNGNGFLKHKNDTINLKDGLLNGDSYFYHYDPHDAAPNYPPVRHVYSFENNYLKSVRVFKKGILLVSSPEIRTIC